MDHGGFVERVERVSLPLFGPHPLIADTNVLYDDIVRRLRRGQGQTALVESGRRGATRLFATSHVYEEMYDHLSGFERRGVDRSGVLRAFEAFYLPLCRFVEMPVDLSDPRVQAVAAVDPSDAPTAALAVLLAPCHVLSVDTHLLEAGFGSRAWLTHVFAAEELLGVEGATVAMALLAGEGAKRLGGLAREIADSTRELLRSSEAARLLAAGVGGAALLLLLLADPEALAAGARGVAVAAGKSGLVGLQIAAEPAKRRGALYASAVQPNVRRSREQRIARLLLGGPLGSEQIAIQLATPGVDVERALIAHPAFVQEDGLWSVGKIVDARGRASG